MYFDQNIWCFFLNLEIRKFAIFAYVHRNINKRWMNEKFATFIKWIGKTLIFRNFKTMYYSRSKNVWTHLFIDSKGPLKVQKKGWDIPLKCCSDQNKKLAPHGLWMLPKQTIQNIQGCYFSVIIESHTTDRFSSYF